MANADSVKDKLHRLIDDANATTGGTADTVAKAVEQLRAGYGEAPALTELSVAENGTYTPDLGTDGFSQVDVQVPDRYDEGYNNGNMNADLRYQEGYDMGRSDGYTEGHDAGYNEGVASAGPERSYADVVINRTDIGVIDVYFPEGHYPDITKSYNFEELIKPYWFINSGNTITKLYFNTQWTFNLYGVQVSLDDVLRSGGLYRYYDFNGIRVGECDLLVGDVENGNSVVCAFFDFTALQAGLYGIGVGNVSNMTIIYSTQDYDFTALGLPYAGKAGWNAAEADFPCTIRDYGDIYYQACWGLISKVPVRFGN